MDEPIFDPVTYALLKSQLNTDNIQNESEYVTGEDLTEALDNLNNAIAPSSETISTGITGVTAKKINGWFVQISFYITTSITVNAGDLYSLGTLPEALRPSANQSYLLLLAKSSNAPTVAGLRVAATGEVLIYNISASEVTYQTIQGIAYYPTI